MALGGGGPLAEINRIAVSAKFNILVRDISVPGSTISNGVAIKYLIFMGKELCYGDAIEELNMLNITQKL